MKRTKKGISKGRIKELVKFQKGIGISFKNLTLLSTALSHKSYVNEVDELLENNEKLEFLGDAFLGLVISATLYNQNLYLKEGSLARIKSYVVSEATLDKIGREIGIQNYILVGKGEEKSGGRNRKSLISDSVEAVIGAYYLDSGYRQAKVLVQKLFLKEIIEVEKNRHVKDYKSILQEYSQKRYRSVPKYSVVDMKGPDHRKKFYVNVSVRKKTFGPGIGDNKKEAEQMAASIALSHMKHPRGIRDPSIEKAQSGFQERIERGGIVRSRKRTKNSEKHAGE
jgi:ribonuclease-3